MAIVEWVERLGADLGLGALPLAARGACEVLLEDGTAFSLELARDGETLFLHAALGPVPPEGPGLGLVLEALLAANHVEGEEEGEGAALDGAALAIDPVMAEVVLGRVVAPGEAAGYEEFAGLVAGFVRRAGAERDRLRALGGPPGQGDPPPAPGRADDPMFLHAHFVRA
jgi:hypothetical protein